MAGTSSAKTRFALLPGHDEKMKRRHSGMCRQAQTRNLEMS
jgi:hypothetical protein